MTGDDRATRAQLVDASRRIAERGLTHGSTGNISARHSERILISPSGSRFSDVRLDDFATIDMRGNHLAGPTPSKEAFMHAAILRSRPQSTAVVHTHSTHSVAVSCLEEVDVDDVLPPITAYYAMRVGSLPLLPYFAPGDQLLEPEVQRLADTHAALLLRNHGPIIAAGDLHSAIDAIEELEETAKLYLMLRGMAIRPLTPDQRAALSPVPTTQ